MSSPLLSLLVPSLLLLGWALGVRAGYATGRRHMRAAAVRSCMTISGALRRGGGAGGVRASDALRAVAEGLERVR